MGRRIINKPSVPTDKKGKLAMEAKALEDLKLKQKEINNSMNSNKGNIEKLNVEFIELEKKITNLKIVEKSIGNSIDEREILRSELESEIKEMNEEKGNLSTNLNGTRKTVEEFTDRANATKEKLILEISDMTSNLALVEHKRDKTMNESNAQVKAQEEAILVLKGEKEKLEEVINDKTKDITALESIITETDNKLSEVKLGVIKEIERGQNISFEIEKSNKELSIVNKQGLEKIAEIEKLDMDIKFKTTEVENKQAEIDNYEKAKISLYKREKKLRVDRAKIEKLYEKAGIKLT